MPRRAFFEGGVNAAKKVKTFASVLRVFHTGTVLADLGEQVNGFREQNDVTKVLCLSDACTTDNTGAAMGGWLMSSKDG